LILGFNLGLAVLISNSAEKTLLAKQRQFGQLLAENLSHQVYTRFAVPTLLRYGTISLRERDQYQQLDKVVRSTIHSFHVRDISIYDLENRVAYSTNEDLLGREGLANDAVRRVVERREFISEFVSKIPRALALFQWEFKPGSMLLLAYAPLRAERSLSPTTENPLMGVVEFAQDITDDYVAVVNFERLVVASTLFTSLVLFTVIVMILRRADRLNMQRLAEKERLEREISQQEKLAGIGRMVAGVAHEIRNPLGIIQSSAELLLKRFKDDDGPTTRILQALFDETKRLSRTVNDFLDYARPKKPRLDEVDAGKLLDQVALFLEPECQKRGVTIERECAPGVTVRGDKDLLYRAFYNVVSNSLQAMDGPGRIAIKAFDPGDGARVVFTDTGPGFNPEHLDKVRDPFFTTRDTGTGLGLAIVSSILEGHGATLNLSAGENGGAKVEMVFPKA
jgi:signal transduction histidine kinase